MLWWATGIAAVLVAQKDVAVHIKVTNSHVTREGIHVGEN